MSTRANWFCLLACLTAACSLIAATAADPATRPAPAPITAPGFEKAAVVRVSGEIDDFVRDSVYRNVADARAQGARTIILEINTYGGLLTAGLDTSSFLKRQNDLHIIAFVHDKAISAGAMIAMACDEIVMDPSGRLGDCAPIIFQSDGTVQGLPPTERAKEESPVLADFRDSAQRNGHDVHLAEAMVAINHPVYCLIDSHGQRHFADEKEKDALLAKGMKLADDVPNPINTASALLTVHGEEAVKIGLATGIADDADALAQARGLQIIATLAPGWGETLVQFLSSGIVRGILITIFVLALQVALSAPGHGAAEAIAIVALAVVLGVPLLTGYALWWEVMLILVGLALVAFEIFVFPGHFVSLIVGSMMVAFGLVLTFAGHDPGAPPWLPETRAGWTALRDGLAFVLGSFAASALLGAWLSRYLPSIPYFNRLVLTAVSGGTPTPADHLNQSAWPAVGVHGRATVDLRPGGLAEFADGAAGDHRVVSVVAESGFIPAGSRLVVRESRGSYVIVRAVPNGTPTA